MQRPKSDLSLTVSSQISKYILNRARQAYLHRIHTEALNQRSHQVSKQFPVECTQTLMELASFQAAENAKRIVEEYQLSPPQSCRDYHRPLRTLNVTPRLSSKPFEERTSIFRPKGTIRKTVEIIRSMQQPRKCQPLQKQQEDDQQIQMLREKKQRVLEMQRYFIQAQKQEKNKLRHKQSEQISQENVTTDFNGQRIEIRRLNFKRDAQPFLMVQMGLSIRGEKQQNKLHTAQEQPILKMKNCSKESSLKQTKYDGKSKPKLPKESINLQSFTLKEIQNLINKDKQKKNQTMNRISKQKTFELIQLNLMKII